MIMVMRCCASVDGGGGDDPSARTQAPSKQPQHQVTRLMACRGGWNRHSNQGGHSGLPPVSCAAPHLHR